MTSPSARRRRLALAGVLVALGVLGGGAVAAGAATPSPSATAEDAAADTAERTAEEAERKAARDAGKTERKAERNAGKTERKAERKAGKAARRAAVTGPAFVCDPALSHGQNVSAYARSLPKGPGRGRLVSQAARSDCGKTSADD